MKVFFLIYDARSGSTYLANLLAKKFCITIPPETNVVPWIIETLSKHHLETVKDLDVVLEVFNNEPKFADWNLSPEQIRDQTASDLPVSLKNFFLNLFHSYQEQNNEEEPVFGIKKGCYMRYHNELRDIFPDCYFLCLMRDGRAVFNSKKSARHSITGQPYETNPIDAANQWKERTSTLKSIHRDYDRSLLLKYESLIKHPEEQLNRIQNFLSVDWRNDQQQNGYNVTDRYGSLHENIENDPMENRITAWQDELSEQEIHAYETIAGECLRQNEYNLFYQELPSKPPLRYRMYYRLKKIAIKIFFKLF